MRTYRQAGAWLALLAVLSLLGVLQPYKASAAPTADACNPRPAITSSMGTDGAVDLAAGYGLLTSVQFGVSAQYVGSQNNVTIDIPGVNSNITPPYTYTLNPPAATLRFYVHPITAGPPVTQPITVMDGCTSSPWSTFVGAGQGVIPTATPYSTLTPVPTVPGPTRTPTPLPPEPTSTPLTQIQAVFSPTKVYQGGVQVWNWFGRTIPKTTDYMALYNLNGQAAGPPIYTSSCTTTPGTVAKSQGWCNITFGANFTPGNYVLRFIDGSNGVTLWLLSGDQIVAAGGSIDGRGAEQGTTSILDYDDFALVGGFLAVQSYLSVPDPSWQSADSWYHIGLNSIGNYTGLFIETGIHKACTLATVPNCLGHPYMSWVDNNDIIEYIEWDGSPSFGPGVYYPNANLPLSAASEYLFKVYETAATAFTGEFCDLTACCIIWLDGLPCREIATGDRQPTTLQTRFMQVFGGTETLSPRIAGGVGDIGWPEVCCSFNQIHWTPLHCWDHEWRTLDPLYVLGILTDCNPLYSGWGVQTMWRAN